MNKQETIQIMTLMAGNYDSIANKDKTQKQLMVNTWLELLGDLDYKVVLQAVKMSMINSPYPPTIHDIRKNAVEMMNPDNQRTAIEAWTEAYKMICKGAYMTQEEFETASPEVKSFFGDVRQVRELSQTDIDTVNTVTKGQFLKQYEVIIQRNNERKLLPQEWKTITEKLVNNWSVKQLKESEV